MDGISWFLLAVGVALIYRGVKAGRRGQAMPSKLKPSHAVPSSAPTPLKPCATYPPASPTGTSSKKKSGYRWLPANESCEIAGFSISDGMLYIGRWADRMGIPKCLIDPSLPVARSAADLVGQHMSYWPSYADMDPRSRRALLQWLAEGRSDPNAYIGYVFLYFYGLERRLILEQSIEDAPAIVAEVRRLRDLYGHNRSFYGYSSDFLEAADLLLAPYVDEVPPTPVPEPSYGLSPRLLVSLGLQFHKGIPLNADWMLAWMLAHPETRLRTPARRAFDEFCTLFRLYFDQRYPEGLKVSPPKSKIGSLSYRVASADFQASLNGDFSEWPSVVNMSRPVNQVMEIAETCMQELEPYSRLLGRLPEAKETLSAQLLLPAPLLSKMGGEVAVLVDWLASNTAPIPVDQLSARLGLSGKAGKAQAREMAEMLEGLGFGVEPDVRLGGRTPKVGELLVVFRLPEGSVPQPPLSAPYQAASLTVGVCAIVTHADGVVSPEEERHLLSLVESNLHLSALERCRFEAHARWLLAVPPSLPQFQARVAGLSSERRQELGRFIIAVATVDGRVAVEEMRLLERLYKLLGLEASQLFSDLHAFESSGDEPVVVRVATAEVPGKAIPRPAPEGVSLDMGRIEHIRADTAKVSSLLSEIFVEEPATQTAQPEPQAEPEPDDTLSPFDGLDRRHEALLREIVSRGEWGRGDFEQLCRSMDLLPGGALESLNEWAFDRFDEAILEDEDPMVVNLSLLPNIAGPSP